MIARALLLWLSLVVSSAIGAEVRIIDGDTLAVGDVTYRLHGIDAPEAGQTCTTASGSLWQCGDAATAHLIELVDGRSPDCEIRGIDDYDRMLSVCWAGSTELNSQMVLDGYAWAFRRYSEDYVDAELIAARVGLGIWANPTQTAWDFRASKWEVALQKAPDGCPIKGNISNNGHIYHTPWSPWYDRTRVSVERGERWFCTEREALDAGWRAPIWGHSGPAASP